MKDSDYEDGTVEANGKRVPATLLIGTRYVYRDRWDRHKQAIKDFECGAKVASTFVPNDNSTPKASSTHGEYVADGYSVTIQHCEEEGCDIYLGVNYPSSLCSDHQKGKR